MNYEAMKQDTNVEAHINRKAAEARARAEKQGYVAFTVSEEHAKVLAARYATVYDYEFEMACADYSDIYKDVYGVRPRHKNFETLEEVTTALQNF